MSTPDVELIFGVTGGGSVGGESYKAIKESLMELTKNLEKNNIPSVKINFNKSEFDKQIAKIKKELKEIANSVTVPINIKEKRTIKSTFSSKKNFETSNAEDISEKIKEKELLKKWKEEEKTAKLTYKAEKSANIANTEEHINALNNLISAYDKLEEKTKNKTGLIEKYHNELVLSLQKYNNELQLAKNKQYTNELKNKTYDDKSFEIIQTKGKEGDKYLKSEIEKTEAKLTKLIAKLGNLKEGTNDATKQGADFIKTIEKGLKSTEGRINKKGKIVNSTAKHLTDLKKLLYDINELWVSSNAKFHQKGLGKDTAGSIFIDKIKDNIFGKLTTAVIAFGARALGQIYSNVVSLDKAVTNLQIATGKTREETRKLIKTYSQLAQELGATTAEVADAADGWLRQGYSIEETNTLIKNSMMLSKLGQLDSAEATRALTSAMKGYKVEVSETERIVDKFTSVDMQAAIGAGDIATAMAETAASAEIAGVNMNTLIGYIATVGEVTQDSAESVGTFYKTLFARMGNVKAGISVDGETGEDLSDVESRLNDFDIKLREANDSFRNFSDVLDDVAGRWENFDNVQKHAIATAFAGTRQQEKFLVLMSNYETALNYATTAANSAGMAQQKYADAYVNSLESKFNRLTASWQEFSASILNAGIISFFVDVLKIISDVLTKISDFGGGFMKNALITVAAITMIIFAISQLKITTIDSFKKFGIMMKTASMSSTTYIGIMISMILTLCGKNGKGGAIGTLIIGCGFLLTTIVLLCRTSTAAVKNADKEIKKTLANNPIGLLILGLTSLAAIIVSIISLIKIFNPSFDKLKEIAATSKETWAETKKELDEVTDKTKELEDRIKELKSLKQEGLLSFTDEEELLKAEQYLSVLESTKKILSDKVEEEEKKAIDDTSNAINKFNEKTVLNFIQRLFGSIAEFVTFGQIDKLHDAMTTNREEKFNAILSDYKNANEEDKTFVNNYITEMQSLLDGYEYSVGEGLSENQIKINSLLDNWYDTLDKVNAANGEQGIVWNFMFDRVKYKEATKAMTDLANTSNVTKEKLQEMYINNESGIKDFIDHLIEIGMFSWDNVESISNLINQIRGLADISSYASESYISMLDKYATPVDKINTMLDEMKENGIISANTISELFKENNELAEKLKNLGTLNLGQDGYTIENDALKIYIENEKKILEERINSIEEHKKKVTEAYGIESEEYKAAEESLKNATGNLENFLITANTLTKEGLIEEYTNMLEEMTDGLESQKAKTEEIYEMRKDLLKTYKDELDYQKELSKKQKNVADISTQLALAKLDKSATGQAKVRELEEELASAEEELDEYTLEKAIDDLSKSIENEQNEYNKFIDNKVNELTKAIDGAASKTAEELAKLLGLQEVEQHHTGGFVGNAKLKSNEEFAKLLKGEFVVTEPQMSNFMKSTMPRIATVGSNSGGQVIYNSPLITLNCNNVTKETIPQVEEIIMKAVKKVKNEIDGALRRSGINNKKIDKFKI